MVPTGSWAGASAELRVSVQSSSFTCQRVREHSSSPDSPAPQQGCGTTGVLESHHCLPHTGAPIYHPEDLAIKVEGQEQPPLYRGKMTLVSVSLSEEAVPACWASQLPGDQLGWSTARGMRRGTGPSQGGWDQDSSELVTYPQHSAVAQGS